VTKSPKPAPAFSQTSTLEPAVPGTLCWVAPSWERGLVVAHDPTFTSVCVAYCDHSQSKVGNGTWPKPADMKASAPVSEHTREYTRNGATYKDTVTAPNYFAVEWVPAADVRYEPPEPKERTPKVGTVYEPIDAVLRGVPQLTARLWRAEAYFAAEAGDDKALFSLPEVKRSFPSAWFFRAQPPHPFWERSIMLPTSNPKYPMSGRLHVQRDATGRWWTWGVMSNNQRFGMGSVRGGTAKYALDGMMAAESALPTVTEKEVMLHDSKPDIPF
jgi:hypothetical protein